MLFDFACYFFWLTNNADNEWMKFIIWANSQYLDLVISLIHDGMIYIRGKNLISIHYTLNICIFMLVTNRQNMWQNSIWSLMDYCEISLQHQRSSVLMTKSAVLLLSCCTHLPEWRYGLPGHLRCHWVQLHQSHWKSICHQDCWRYTWSH